MVPLDSHVNHAELLQQAVPADLQLQLLSGLLLDVSKLHASSEHDMVPN
jgi:hypothetical protein